MNPAPTTARVCLNLMWAAAMYLLPTGCDNIGGGRNEFFEATIGFSLQDASQGIGKTSDGGFVICGFTKSVRDEQDLFVLKLDGNANVRWSKTFGGPLPDAGYAIAEIIGGDVAVVGRANFKASRYNLYALRLNRRGETVWSSILGGPGDQEGRSVYATADGGIVTAGHSSADILFTKLDVTGQLVWQRQFGKPGSDFGRGIVQTSDGGYVLTGYTNSLGNTYQPFIMKVDEDGQEQWTKLVPVLVRTEIYDIVQAEDDGFVLVGKDGQLPGTVSAIAVRVDESGSVIWFNRYAPSSVNETYAIAPAHNNGYVLVGKTFLNTSGTDTQLLLIRIDREGNELWTRAYGGELDEIGWDVQAHDRGGFLAVGTTDSYGAGKGDIYVVRVNENGDIDE